MPTDAIRYSGATTLRRTRASSKPMATIAIGMMRFRSLFEMVLMSKRAGASPPTAESVAPTDLATDVVSARIEGTAFIADVVPASPALRLVENCTVRPSLVGYLGVARHR